MNLSIMVMCESRAETILPVTYEMISCARKISGERPSQITVVLPGNNIKAGPFEGADLLVINSGALEDYSSEGWEKAVLIAAETINPDIVIIPHTSTGYDYAPRVAALLGWGCITSVSGIDVSGDSVTFVRSGFYGKLDMVYEAGTSPVVITVLPGVHNFTEHGSNHGSVMYLSPEIKLEAILSISNINTAERNIDLENAEVIVSAGRGIGKKENLSIIHALASQFRNPAVAGSRVACDNGWIGHNAQVGLTGKTVSPQMYIACGISGSPQHVSGMKDSGTIVSINRDPEAAIFHYSDICIVEDIESFINSFIEVAEKHRALKNLVP